MFKKLYLNVRRFLYSNRRLFNKIAIFIMTSTIIYVLINTLLFEKIILNKADSDFVNHKYKNAITYYNIAYTYYNINHYSQNNKKFFLEIPYNLSMCYYDQKDINKSIKSLLDGAVKIQTQYGFYSVENATYIRKYVIDFFIKNHNTDLVKKELNNLLSIYGKISYDDNVNADLTRLVGDWYYMQKNYDNAIVFYEKAYKMAASKTEINYELLTKIIDKISAYEALSGRIDNAINIYKDFISMMKNEKRDLNNYIAFSLINLGNLYEQNSDLSNAINCYVNAIKIIKKLPGTSYLRHNIKTYYSTLADFYRNTNQEYKASEIDVELARQRRFGFLN